MPLKILVVIEKDSWVDSHIANSLELMGHAVFRFYFGEYVSEFYGFSRHSERVQKNAALLDRAKKLRDTEGLDLIFCYVYDDFLLPRYAKALSALNVPMVNYNVDMPYQWYRQIRTACYFDLMLCAQPDNMTILAQYSKKVLYFPMAAQPALPTEAKVMQSKKMHDVSFVGTALPYRRTMLSALSNESMSLSIYGKYWDSAEPQNRITSKERTLRDIWHYGYPRLKAEGLGNLLTALSDRFAVRDAKIPSTMIYPGAIRGRFDGNDLSSLFRDSKINIGLSRFSGDNPNHIGKCQMKLRDFEVPMSGGFYLCEKSPGYDQAFVDGKEVVMWQTLPELLEKINYYLVHDEERELIAMAGQKRALQDHTWAIRFSKLLAELKIGTI